MTATRAWFAAAVLVIAALGGAATTGRGAPRPAVASVAGELPVTHTLVVCPDASGSSSAPTTLRVAAVGGLLQPKVSGALTITRRALAGPAGHSSAVVAGTPSRLTATSSGPVTALAADGSAAATVAGDELRLVPSGLRRALLGSTCQPPATDVWLTGPDGRVGYTDSLVLANPGTTLANLTVSVWATTGALSPPKLASYSLAAEHAVTLPVADYAPDGALLTVHVHANSGRVAAAVLDQRSHGVSAAGGDWIMPTLPPRTDLVVPGFADGSVNRRLVLANPGGIDATVGLHLVTATGMFAPAGHPQVVVPAGRTLDVDLSQSFGTSPGAVVLRSDHPVTAAGLTVMPPSGRRTFPEIAWAPAQQALARPAVLPGNHPPFGTSARLLLTAPAAATVVRVSAAGKAAVVHVAAGRTVSFQPGTALGAAGFGTVVVTPLGPGPVYAARVLYAAGAHGPLVTTELPIELPGSIPLPPARPDIRAAIP
jgi:hypothetical protein